MAYFLISIADNQLGLSAIEIYHDTTTTLLDLH